MAFLDDEGVAYLWSKMKAYVNDRIKFSKPLFTNQIKNAVGTDGQPYNGGLGYKLGFGLGSNGAELTKTQSYLLTGYIPIQNLQTLVLRVSGYKSALDNEDNMKFYDASFNNINIDNNDRPTTNVSRYGGTFSAESAFDDTVNTFTFNFQTFKSKTSWYSSVLTDKGAAYVRVCLSNCNLEKTVVTINEEIAFTTVDAVGL